jgi:hypothetical protein
VTTLQTREDYERAALELLPPGSRVRVSSPEAYEVESLIGLAVAIVIWELVKVGMIPFVALFRALYGLFAPTSEHPSMLDQRQRETIQRERERREPQSGNPKMQQSAPKYHAHGPDGGIIGTFDTILDAEICGLMADGVKAVDLPLVLHERRRLGTYGSLREPEPVRADQPNPPAGPAAPVGGRTPTWGERIPQAPDLREAYPPTRLSDGGGDQA